VTAHELAAKRGVKSVVGSVDEKAALMVAGKVESMVALWADQWV